MKERLRKARRICAVAGDLERLAAWRLAQARERLAALEERRAALLAFLAAPDGYADFFASATMRRLEGLERELAEARARLAQSQERRDAEKGRLRQAERRVGAAASAAARSEEAALLMEAIEAALQPREQGPGKSGGSV
ncbi:hypothetical protein [Methylocella sp.]|uniref:hypothetical protein n=1 Tax=Methylocella sp. TaxID=1978226 RepID=UPI0037830217